MNAVQIPKPEKVFTVDHLEVRVYATDDELALAAAWEAGHWLRECLACQGNVAAILGSATSQIKFLKQLTTREDVDWSRINLFHMDEYLGISGDHSASFRRFIRERVAEPLKSRHVHYLEGDTTQPLEECERYGRLLKAQPIDLCCLGIGENGHLAFNDPAVADFGDRRTVKSGV